MTTRVIEYFHAAVPREFASFLLKRTRLRGVDMTIAENFLADEELDTAGYAQLVHMDKHSFSKHCGTVFRAFMRELISLALEAWQLKYKDSESIR